MPLSLPNTVFALLLSLPIALYAQGQEGTKEPEKLDAYGPYAAKFLPGGRGLAKPLNGGETVLEADVPWTLSLWFRTDRPGMTTLLAGLGDPAAEDSRYLGLRNGKPVLRLGFGNEIDAQAAAEGEGWHFLSATFNPELGTAQAHLYLDGHEVASGNPAMGAVSDAELLIGPDFISDKEDKYAYDQAHLPLTVPERLKEWQHFGGSIAGFELRHGAATPQSILAQSQTPPNDTILYEDGSKPWPFQVRQFAGYTAPQPPDTLPHSKAAFSKPVAQPLPPASPTLEQTAANQWTVAHNWLLQAEPQVHAAAAQVSSPEKNTGVSTTGWYPATIPGTVLTTLVDRGVYPDPDYDLNNLAIPESLNKQSYWYRVAFPTPSRLAPGKHTTLDLNGINYAAQVWFNGHELGTITGAFIRGTYDVTALLKPTGDNVLAVRITPPPHPGIPWEESIKGGPGENGGAMLLDGPTFAATEGWDWIPSERDRNTGIWQDVTLTETGDIELGDPQIITTLPLPRRDTADVLINVPVTNTGTAPEKATLHASFEGGVAITKTVTVPPGESTVALTPEEFRQLHVANPRLWWPNGYGKPELYHLKLSVEGAGKSTDGDEKSARGDEKSACGDEKSACGDEKSARGDEKIVQFGIREVTYEESLFGTNGTLRRVEVNPTMALALHQVIVDVSHEGIRQTPGGWAASLTAAADRSPAVKPVGNEPDMTDLVFKVNGVRIAARGGNWGMDDARKRISRAHLEPYFRLHQLANVNIIRNWVGQSTEPVFFDLADRYGLMVWNDFWESTGNYNAEAQDPALFIANAADVVKRYRNHPSIVMWCARNEGVPQPALTNGLAKMLEELDGTRYYTPSSNQVDLRNSGPYKYQDPKLYFDTLNRGFSVELGVGAGAGGGARGESRAPASRGAVSDAWTYHDWHTLGNGTIRPFMQHLDAQFGAPVSLEDMERKAQMLNYTLHQAIFEGFTAHLWQPNSGRMIWMTQPAWPSNMWQMLSHDYDTQASFYGVMHASEPRHVQLDISTYDVAVINTTTEPLTGTITASVYSLANKQLFTKSMPVSLAMNTSANLMQLPLANLLKQTPGEPTFVRLTLTGSQGQEISNSFYWLADKEEDMRKLNTLPEAQVAAKLLTRTEGEEKVVTAVLTNQGKQAALELKLTLEEAQGGERILPAYYSDNYVSLLPGESRIVTIHYPATAATGTPALGLRAYNLRQTVLMISK